MLHFRNEARLHCDATKNKNHERAKQATAAIQEKVAVYANLIREAGRGMERYGETGRNRERQGETGTGRDMERHGYIGRDIERKGET